MEPDHPDLPELAEDFLRLIEARRVWFAQQPLNLNDLNDLPLTLSTHVVLSLMLSAYARGRDDQPA